MMVIVPPPPLKYSHTIGLLALTGRGFSNPMNAAVTDDGIIYVANRSNSTQALQGAVRVTVCNIQGDYLGEFGKYGTEDGAFVWPTAIDVDRQGNIYLADEHRHDVQVWDKDHSFVRKWGGLGNGDTQMNRPAGLATDSDGNIEFVDWGNERVSIFEPSGYPLTAIVGDADLSRWGAEYISASEDIIRGRAVADLSPEKQFWGPTGVVIDAAGHLLVVDS